MSSWSMGVIDEETLRSLQDGQRVPIERGGWPPKVGDLVSVQVSSHPDFYTLRVEEVEIIRKDPEHIEAQRMNIVCSYVGKYTV